MKNTATIAEAKNGMVMLPTDELQVGATCRSDLKDDNGLLLLGAGTTITADLIQGLKDRNIDELAVNVDELDSLRHASDRSRRRSHNRAKQSAKSFQSEHPSKWSKGVPLKDNMVDRHHEPYDSSRRKVLQEHVKLARDQFEQITLEVTERKTKTIEALSELSGAFASAMIDDHDQTVADVVAAESTISLTDRSVKLSVLGMAVGTEMGLDGPSVLEIGTTGLLHDIGLFSMDPSLTVPGRGPFDDEESWEYRKHPSVSATALREAPSVSHSVLTAIEQVHEQYDGNGYPFGVEGKRIHSYARILNVCDTYLRLTLGTSFRQALVPHDALGVILHQAQYQVFDPQVVRAFLRVESLFPLGSQVKIDDDVIANVIRRPIAGYAHPVLQTEDGERIDLNNQIDAVVRPLADPSFNQTRLTQTEMRQLRWNPADELLLA